MTCVNCGVVCVFRNNVLPDNLIIVGLFIHRPMTYDPYTVYLLRMQRPTTPLKLRLNSLTSNSFIVPKAYHYPHTLTALYVFVHMVALCLCFIHTPRMYLYCMCINVLMCSDHLERQYFKNCVSQTCWDSFTV